MSALDCWCEGWGETLGHASGCRSSYCALAGGVDDCDGEVQLCFEHASEEQLATTRDDHGHADQLLACACCETLLRWPPGDEMPPLFCDGCAPQFRPAPGEILW